MEETLTWARSRLLSLNMPLTGEPEMLRDMPWSRVARLPTARGDVYLKTMTAPFKVEPALLAFLAQRYGRLVPQVLADNPALQAFLMADAGVPLRTHLVGNYTLPLPVQALQNYARIQQDMLPETETLLALGVPDWRLENLPRLFANLVENTALMQVEGLTPADQSALLALRPRLEAVCARLLAGRVPQTLEHCDFQDNNLLLKDGHLTLNDWGDAILTHPFISLAGFLSSVEGTHGFAPQSAEYEALKQAYLQSWHPWVGIQEAETLLADAQTLRHLTYALNFARVGTSTTAEEFAPYAGYIAETLGKLTTALTSQT